MSKEKKIDDAALENVSGGTGISHLGDAEGGGGGADSGTGGVDKTDAPGGGNNEPEPVDDGPTLPGGNDTPFSNYG